MRHIALISAPQEAFTAASQPQHSRLRTAISPVIIAADAIAAAHAIGVADATIRLSADAGRLADTFSRRLSADASVDAT